MRATPNILCPTVVFTIVNTCDSLKSVHKTDVSRVEGDLEPPIRVPFFYYSPPALEIWKRIIRQCTLKAPPCPASSKSRG